MRKPDAIPMPELFARAVGKIQFTCPNCGQEHPFKHIQWRRADFKCQRCKVVFQLGLGFSYSKGPEAYLMGKSNKYTINRWQPIGTAYDGAKIYGNIEWQCVNCQQPQTGLLSYDNKLSCERCSGDFYVSVLIFRYPGRERTLKAPFDSVVKDLHVRETIQPVLAKTSCQGAGETS